MKGDALLRDWEEGGEFYEGGAAEEGAWEGEGGEDYDGQDYYEDLPEASPPPPAEKRGFFARLSGKGRSGGSDAARGGGKSASGGSVQQVDW